MTENRKRNHTILLRVSEQEKNVIQRKMAASGIVNREAYLRKMAIDGYVIKLNLEDAGDLVRLLQSAGASWNQIAKRVNQSEGNIYEADLQDIQERQKQLLDAMNRLQLQLAEILK